ncbi:MAG: GAP family protein [Actinomycetota bacterium]|nr:GAP family protein [Actinomycetota bacterium]
MLSTLSETLPFAIGVAASAVAVIALVLILQGSRALSSGLSFTLGWVLGVGVVCAAGVAFGLAVSDDPARWTQWLRTLLGALLLVAAIRKWRQRVPSGEEPTPPKLMSGLQDSAPGKAAVLGFLLGGINPKNLMLTLGAAATLGASGLSSSELWITGFAYVVVASVTVLVPMGIYVLMRSKADELLANLGEWMKSNSDAITIVVLVIFGVKLLLGGLAGLT